MNPAQCARDVGLGQIGERHPAQHRAFARVDGSVERPCPRLGERDAVADLRAIGQCADQRHQTSRTDRHATKAIASGSVVPIRRGQHQRVLACEGGGVGGGVEAGTIHHELRLPFVAVETPGDRVIAAVVGHGQLDGQHIRLAQVHGVSGASIQLKLPGEWQLAVTHLQRCREGSTVRQLEVKTT